MSDAKFWDGIAAKYARSPISDQETYEKKLKITQSYLNPSMRVLEFGCGTGTTALRHAPFVAHIHAVDFSRDMIEIARGKLTSADVQNVTFDVAAVEDLRADEAKFDAILGLNVLHLLREPEDAIAASFDLLKPGGVFVTSTACIRDMRSWFKYIIPVAQAVGYAPYVNSFTEADYMSWLDGAGFTVEHRWLPSPKTALFVVARKPG